MADKKISELTAITGADTAADDFFIVVDTSGSATKKISRAELVNSIEVEFNQLNSNLDTNGNDILFGDNDKATFGNGLDLQIYHDPAAGHSQIREGGSGNLYIAGTNIIIEDTSGVDYITAISGGAVSLTHSGSQKLATTASGVSITGSLDADGLTVDGTVDINGNYLEIGDGTATAQVAIIAGTTGNSTLDFGDSADSNIGRIEYAHTSDALTFRTNNSERMRLDSSGRLGLGSTSPSALLTVEDTDAEINVVGTRGTGTTHRIFTGGANSQNLNVFSGGDFYLNADNQYFRDTSSNVRMTITSGGNVGIGMTPAYKLDVTGINSRLTSGSTAYTYYDVNNSYGTTRLGTSSSGVGVVGTVSALPLQIIAGNSEAMRVTTSGSVGIGDTSPDAKLDVYSTSGSTTDIGRFEAAVGGYTGTSLIAANTLGPASTYNLFKCISDSDGDGGGPYTEFVVRGDGNVGIGTAAPDTLLHLSDATGGAIVRLERNDTVINANDIYGEIQFEGQDASAGSSAGIRGKILGIAEDGTGAMGLAFHTAAGYSSASEKARLDSSGNLLTGKTAANSTVQGVELSPNGYGIFTSTNNHTQLLNRTGTDGSIITLRKDGSTLGSIGNNGTNLFIATDSASSNAAGLKFVDGTPDRITPCDGSGADLNATIDLGDSSTRFKNLYLSGGVYLGGTGASNLLDDYEEGTYNPTLTATGGTITLSASTDTMSYTKIGRMVTISGRVIIGSVSGSPTGTVYFSLPFSVVSGTEDSDYAAFQVYTYGVDLAAGAVSTFGEAAGGSSSVGLLYQVDNTGWGGISASGYSAGDIIYVNGSYFTA